MAKHTGRDRVVCAGELDEPSGDFAKAQGDYREWLRDVRAQQIMNSPIAWLRHDQPISEAADLFLRTRIDSAPSWMTIESWSASSPRRISCRRRYELRGGTCRCARS